MYIVKKTSESPKPLISLHSLLPSSRPLKDGFVFEEERR